MSIKVILSAVVAAAVVGTVAACAPVDDGAHAPGVVATPESSEPSSAVTVKSGASDYSHLLLQAEDISIPPEAYTVRSSQINPDGQTGVSVLFVNADETRAISDTILIYPDAETAAATLQQAATAASSIVVDGEVHPVGQGGIVVSGLAPDGSKAVTLLMYPQGRAVVRLQFDSNPDDPMPEDTVASVGRMQQIALRLGLPERA